MNGGGHAAAVGELPPNLYTNFKEPSFNPYFKYDTLSQIKFTIGAFIIPSVTVNLYEGAVTGELSLTAGPELETTISAGGIISGETCDIFDGLDISLAVSVDASIGTKYDEDLKVEANLWNTKFPLFNVDGTECPNTSTCSGDDFFTDMIKEFADKFNQEIFQAQGVSPSDPMFPSTGKCGTSIFDMKKILILMHCCTCPFLYCSLQVRGFCQCTEQPQRTRRQGTIAVSDVARRNMWN